MNDTLIPLIAICWILCAFLCAFIAQTKRLNTGMWALAGLIFGVFAVLVIALEPARSTTPDGEPDNAQPVTPLQQWLSTPSLWDYRNRKRNHS